MRMHNPPHPGKIIKALCLDPLGLTVTEAAVRLSIAFDTSAESWINQQTQYDLWHAEQGRKQLRVLRLAA
ncbi:MAG: addiction module antidote protein, HigA family [Betaproteobacteria bacterium]|nr:addiction module antidote protein, HigA family [Betaproteobacteria bacterium]